MPVGLGHWPERARQAQRQRTQPGLVAQVVGDRVAWFGKAEPDLAVQATHQVVRVARQVVHKYRGLRIGLRGQCADIQIVGTHRDLPDAVAARFVDKQTLLILAKRDAIGKAQAFGDDAGGLGGGIELKDAAGGCLFDDVEHAGLEGSTPVFGREAGRGIAQIHLAVLCNHYRVGIADWIAIDVVGQHGDLRVCRDGDQSFDRVGGDHIAIGVKVKTQHTPTRVGKDMLV